MSDENTNMNDDPWKVTSHEEVKSTNEVVPVKADASNSNLSVDALRSDFGLVSMICGIISIIFGFTPWGILGLIFGILSNRGKKNSQATAGIVCSIVGFVLHLILLIVFVIIYFSFMMRIFTSEGFPGNFNY
ncbi:MAG: DUF4190 domain-containing protein [Treponema sp.]|nr:DUF4190 domain-containing protein [Treponema sp.]